MGIILSIVIGILAGFIAGKLMKGGGFGCLWNLLLGVVGGFVGGQLFGLLNISLGTSWVGELITAVIGAVLVLWVCIHKAHRRGEPRARKSIRHQAGSYAHSY